ncbi:MAG: MMPL family transporter [Spirochaetales bacterium]|nr:MMPL family transporter [Spirochaetales bacterium]
MNTLFNFSNKHPLITILILISACILAGLYVGDLYLDSSPASMMMKDDPNREFYAESLDKFSSDNILAIYIEDADLFSPEKLGKLEEFIRTIDNPKEFPDITRIESLLSVNNFKGYPDYLDSSPLMETAPDTLAEAQKIKENALGNPIFEKNLISKNGNATMVNIYLRPVDPSQKEDTRETVLKVRELIDGSDSTPGYIDNFNVIFEIGRPFMSEQITSIIMHDMTILLPIAFVILMIMLTLTMGSLVGALLPIMTSSLSIFFTFGFMGAFNLPLNLVTFIVPILVIVIGSSEDVHILSTYKEVQILEKNPDKAIRKLSRILGTAVFLTSLTTFLGFLSISINEITALVQFGIVAGFAMLINPITTFLFSPLYLKYLVKDSSVKKERRGDRRVNRFFDTLSLKIIDLINIKGQKLITILLLFAVVVAAFTVFIEVDNDTKGFFKKNSILSQRLDILDQEMSGTTSFQVVLWQNKGTLPEIQELQETLAAPVDDDNLMEIDIFAESVPGESLDIFDNSEDELLIFEDLDEELSIFDTPDTDDLPKELFKEPAYLLLLSHIKENLNRDYDFDKIISIADYIQLLNREMNVGIEGDFDRIPASEDPRSANLIAQYVLNLHREEIEPYVTADWSEARIIIKHNISSSRNIKETVKGIEKDIRIMLDEVDPLLEFKVTGENVLINDAADSITKSQVLGLGLLLTTIFIIMSILFMNIKAGLLSLIPNLFPVFLFFGFMGIFKIPLNLGTCMVAAIAIGLSVDDTIHFMTSFNHELRKTQDKKLAVKNVMGSEIRPIISTSISLILSFGTLTLAQLMPLVYFGFLSAIVILRALIADLLITPILLSKFQLVNISDLYKLKLAEELKSSPVFQDMSMNEIKKFVLMGKVSTKASGENIITIGETEQKIYILLSGKAVVVRKDESSEQASFLAEISTGAILGEISLLRDMVRSATVTVTEDVSYLEIDWSGLERLKKSSKTISMKLYRNIAAILGNRLVEMTDKVIMLQKDKT